MTTPDAVELLARLGELEKQDVQLQNERSEATAVRPEFRPRFVPGRNPLEKFVLNATWLRVGDHTVNIGWLRDVTLFVEGSLHNTLGKRRNARRALGRLIKHLFGVSDSESLQPACAATSHEADSCMLATVDVWLGDFEHELLEERIMFEASLTPPSELQMCGEPQLQEQLTKWNAKLAAQRDIWSRALKWVLEYKICQRNMKVLQAASILGRITQPSSFPPELLIQITETVVNSQVPNGNVATSCTAEGLTKELFALPKEFDGSARELLRDTVAEVLSKSNSIKIPASFATALTLAVPPVLVGNEHHIRRLVLDLQVFARDQWPHAKLNRSTESMASMASLLPNLKTCIILCHFRHANMETEVNFTSIGSERLLRLMNVKTVEEVVSMKETLLQLIEAFKEHGPGKVKFIRFSHEANNGAKLGVGPLTCVSRPHKLNKRETEVFMKMSSLHSTEKGATITDAETVLHRAYWGPLTPPAKVNRTTKKTTMTEAVTLRDDGVLEFKIASTSP